MAHILSGVRYKILDGPGKDELKDALFRGGWEDRPLTFVLETEGEVQASVHQVRRNSANGEEWVIWGSVPDYAGQSMDAVIGYSNVTREGTLEASYFLT